MTSDPLIGRQIANYRIERVIGRGGMAQVYYGWDVTLDRPVAVKVIDARFRDDPSYARRFVREARTVAKWRHEHILQIHYANDEEGLYYFVMEYIEGQNLGEWMVHLTSQGKKAKPAEVIRIGRAVASALDYAHENGVIHRDVKPSNIILAQDGRVVLADFGLAMDVALGSLGEVFGSAHYIAPEQARRSADAVPQSDLYSLGVVLYKILTGTVPFDDPSPASVALQHIIREVPSPRTFDASLTLEVEQVILKALSKSPEKRYQTGKELIDALEAALQMTLSLPERRIELPPPPAGLSPPTPSLPSTSETLLGAQLDEYRLDTLLGKGGMARVYRGLDPKLRRYVAIKVIDTPFRADSDHIMRFEREAQAIAQLEHPNIVRLYRYGEANGLLYMAMQYIKGADLQAVIASYREDGELIPLEGAVRIVQEICHALDYMHSKGVIHRDVTPSNIMLNEDGQAILTDFGLVLLTDISTRGKIFGSPHYIAPEQAISSAGAVPQSDLYSVGVILYELLTGEVPFDAEETLEIAMQHMSDLPRPPRELREAIRPEIEAVVLKALAKEPENRHPTGVALAADLAAALELTRAASPLLSTQPRPGLSVPERVATQLAEDPLPSISEALKPEKKRRGSWAVVGVSSLVLATAVLIGWFFFVDKRLPNPFQFAAAPIPTETAMPPATKTNTTTPTASGSGLTGPAQTPTPSPSPTFTLEPSPTPSTELKASPTESPTATPSPTPIPATSTPTSTSSPTASPTTTPTETATPAIKTIRAEDNMVMVLIPAGMFSMGAAADDPNAGSDERPQHQVTLDSFYIDQFEVSVAQYAVFLNELGSHAPSACLGYTCLRTQFESIESHLIWNAGAIYEVEEGFENHPVNNLTWFGAAAYCEWVGARLPTEAEWEFAARGFDDRLYPWGNEAPDETMTLFGQVSFGALLAVDALPNGASFFDVFGMAGSVWEWVSDFYAENYYANSPEDNPAGPEGGSARSPRVLRGGSWKTSLIDLRTTARWGVAPLDFDEFGSDVGFRCARSISEP